MNFLKVTNLHFIPRESTLLNSILKDVGDIEMHEVTSRGQPNLARPLTWQKHCLSHSIRVVFGLLSDMIVCF